MKNFFYSIKDVDAGEFGPLFAGKNDLVAGRAFRQFVQPIPEEELDSYELWCICEFDTESGQLSLPFEPYKVTVELKKKEVPVQGFDNK